MGALPRIRVFTKTHFKNLSIWWGRYVITETYHDSKHLASFLSSEYHIYLSLLFCAWTSHVCGVPIYTYIIKFVYFSIVNLLVLIELLYQLKETRRVEESFFSPNINVPCTFINPLSLLSEIIVTGFLIKSKNQLFFKLLFYKEKVLFVIVLWLKIFRDLSSWREQRNSDVFLKFKSYQCRWWNNLKDKNL